MADVFLLTRLLLPTLENAFYVCSSLSNIDIAIGAFFVGSPFISGASFVVQSVLSGSDPSRDDDTNGGFPMYKVWGQGVTAVLVPAVIIPSVVRDQLPIEEILIIAGPMVVLGGVCTVSFWATRESSKSETISDDPKIYKYTTAAMEQTTNTTRAMMFGDSASALSRNKKNENAQTTPKTTIGPAIIKISSIGNWSLTTEGIITAGTKTAVSP